MGRALIFGTQPVNLSTDPSNVPHYGVFELALDADPGLSHPIFDVTFSVTFTRPDGSTVTTEGFFDGCNRYRARAYGDQAGEWRWNSRSSLSGLNGHSGTFTVHPSSLKGQLQRHPNDPHQFAYADGTWFLHIGDTGYRFVVDLEPEWQAYIDQAASAGFTKIRTWFCRGRSDVQALFTPDRRSLNLPYWQEIDRRLRYALNHHPDLIFKVIPYGEDTGELRRYGEDPITEWIPRYAQARFSAFPNVTWCISNDRQIVGDEEPLEEPGASDAPSGMATANAYWGGNRKVRAATIDRIGEAMAAREPWGTLLTNHQCRFSGYTFTDAPWSDLITLEDIDQVHGALIRDYRTRANVPVVNDEDRYEHYRPPQHPRYFFRRLFWASLLSGGHVTYGGLRSYETYDGDAQGIAGYWDAARAGKLTGAHDFRNIHAFFRDSGLTLVGFEPDDSIAGNDPLRYQCTRTNKAILVYLANPSGTDPESDDVAGSTPEVALQLDDRTFALRWFDPATAEWFHAPELAGGAHTLTAPGPGDWVLWLQSV